MTTAETIYFIACLVVAPVFLWIGAITARDYGDSERARWPRLAAAVSAFAVSLACLFFAGAVVVKAYFIPAVPRYMIEELLRRGGVAP